MIKRLLAFAGVAALVACVVTTLVFAVTGNPNFLGMLLVTLMFPVLLWVFMFIYKLLKDRSNET